MQHFVQADGWKMMIQIDLVYKIKVRVDDLPRRAAGKYLEKKRKDPFIYETVAVAEIIHFALQIFGP